MAWRRVINAGLALRADPHRPQRESPALVADGRHIMTDVVTSVGVLAGLVGVIATGWRVLDPLLAMLVAINILWQGWRVVGSSLDGLMDRAVDTDEHMRIRDIISANSKGAIEVHDLKTRIAGRATFIEFHLVVDADMTRRRQPRDLRPHRGSAEGGNPLGAGHHPCRAGRRSQAAEGHDGGAVRLKAPAQLRDPSSGAGRYLISPKKA